MPPEEEENRESKSKKDSKSKPDTAVIGGAAAGTLENRIAELDAREKELLEREKALEEKEKAAALKTDARSGPKPEPRNRVPVRHMAVRRCYAPIDLDKPETCRVYEPGERVVFYEDQKEKIPRHFKAIPTRVAEAEVQKEADKEIGLVLPAFITKKGKNPMEHG